MYIHEYMYIHAYIYRHTRRNSCSIGTGAVRHFIFPALFAATSNSLCALPPLSSRVQAMPGAHKPLRPALPTNDTILKAAAGNEAFAPTRLRTTARVSTGELMSTRHVHGEIVDDVMMRELHALSSKKERVYWSTSIPPSPSVASEVTHYTNMDTASSPEFLRHQQLATPPTTKRGANDCANYIKGGGGDDGEETPQYGSSSPRYDADYGAEHGADDTTPRYEGRGGEVFSSDTPPYAASPSPAPSSIGRYSASTAASRTRLMEEARARQLYIAQSPSRNGAMADPSAMSGSTTRMNVLTPHTRPTGPGMWPDENQQKAAAAEKRQLCKEQLDLQMSAKKSQLRLSHTNTSGAASSPAHTAYPSQQYMQNGRSERVDPIGETEYASPAKFVNVERSEIGTVRADSKFAVYENEKAIAPLDSLSKREAQELYKSELDQQLYEKRAQTAAAGSKAAGVWVSKKLRDHDLSRSQSDTVSSSAPSASSAMSPAFKPTRDTLRGGGNNSWHSPELRATSAKISTMHWGERDVEAWHESEQKRLHYRADLLAQIAAKKLDTSANRHQQTPAIASLNTATAGHPPHTHSTTAPSPRHLERDVRLGEQLTLAPMEDAYNRRVYGGMGGDMQGKHTHRHKHTNTHTHAHTHTYIHTHASVYADTHTRADTHTHPYTPTHMHTHTHTHTCTHTHTHTCTHIH